MQQIREFFPLSLPFSVLLPPSAPSPSLSRYLFATMRKYDAAKAGFSQTSLRRARSNLVSKAELYGGSSFLLTLPSMQVTKKLFLSLSLHSPRTPNKLYEFLPVCPAPILHLLLVSLVYAKQTGFCRLADPFEACNIFQISKKIIYLC